MPASDAERRLRAQIAAHASWGQTTDRTARTQPGRTALDRRFLEDADGDPQRAEQLRKAHFKRLALKSVRARRRSAELAAEAVEADAEIDATIPLDTGWDAAS